MWETVSNSQNVEKQPTYHGLVLAPKSRFLFVYEKCVHATLNWILRESESFLLSISLYQYRIQARLSIPQLMC